MPATILETMPSEESAFAGSVAVCVWMKRFDPYAVADWARNHLWALDSVWRGADTVRDRIRCILNATITR
ncbi:hypothetical protein ASF40_16875 [Microbacterium sp. Leaf288]|nr:hypothetical protein ASF40_16875 [Microbacterium sp. Leaf288]